MRPQSQFWEDYVPEIQGSRLQVLYLGQALRAQQGVLIERQNLALRYYRQYLLFRD